MTHAEDLRDFLTTRRARITPAEAGLPHAQSTRRVPGLRREEVASLAGISVEYYIRLERGNPGGVSDDVLYAVARALQLSDLEHEHLLRLVRAAGPTGRTARRRPAASSASHESVRPGIRRLLDLIPTPASVSNARFDVLASNSLGCALYSPMYASPTCRNGVPNSLRFAFLDEDARDFFVDLPQVREDAVAYLHTEAAASPHDRRLADLIGELSLRSERFRTLWANADVKAHRTGTKRLRHPIIGEIVLDFEALDISADRGLRLSVYSAAPDSPAAAALDLLASWTASPAEARS